MIKKLNLLKKEFGEDATELEIIEGLVEERLNKKMEAPSKGNHEAVQGSEGRYIPVNVRREVWQRAGGKCEKCGSQHYYLTFEHLMPYALGGDHHPTNLKVLCRNCNIRSAIKTYGQDKMSRHMHDIR